MNDDARSAAPDPGDARLDDNRADRLTFFWVAGFFAAYLIVDVLSQITEKARFNLNIDILKYSVYELTSIIVILALFPFIRMAVSYATPGEHDWRRVAAIHLGAVLAFSAAHIFLMVMLRKAVFLIVFQSPYIFTDNIMREFIYEFRKDAMSYALIAFFISFGRQLAQQRRELAAAREDAQASKRLTLKCGGRAVFVKAADILWAKSASNYVEVKAGGATHLARATLGSIENQLADAGAKAVRVHRSWMVNTDHIARIEPTGEGDLKIEMSDGTLVPGSRRYRDRLPGGG